MTKDDLQQLLRRAMEFEGLIEHTGATKVREASKRLYGTELLDARLSLMAGFAYLFEAKAGVPGAATKSTSDRLALVATFVQGLTAMERLISEGQYAKAAAAMKQDFEIVARLEEIELGVAKAGKQPNVKYTSAPHLYGPLNNVAHPSNEDVLRALLQRWERGTINALSPVPVMHKEAARDLYELHVYTMIEVLQHAIALFVDMYPGDAAIVDPAVLCYTAGTANAQKAGFTVRAAGAAP